MNDINQGVEIFMGLNHKDDLFMLQIRLFRLAQIRWNKTAEECERIFVENSINDYIQTCYEEFHTQGDETNLDDIEVYLKRKGLTI